MKEESRAALADLLDKGWPEEIQEDNAAEHAEAQACTEVLRSASKKCTSRKCRSPIKGAEPQNSPCGAEFDGQSMVESYLHPPAPPAQLLIPAGKGCLGQSMPWSTERCEVQVTSVMPMRSRIEPVIRGGNIWQ